MPGKSINPLEMPHFLHCRHIWQRNFSSPLQGKLAFVR